MYVQLAAAALVAVALAGSHWKAYHAGNKAGTERVQTAWDADLAQRTAKALDASELRRIQEKASQNRVEGIRNEQIKLATARAAADAHRADRLRALEAALVSAGAASGDTATPSGTDDPRAAIINQCAGALGELDKTAQRLASEKAGLQAYARELCVTP